MCNLCYEYHSSLNRYMVGWFCSFNQNKDLGRIKFICLEVITCSKIIQTGNQQPYGTKPQYRNIILPQPHSHYSLLFQSEFLITSYLWNNIQISNCTILFKFQTISHDAVFGLLQSESLISL